MNKAKRTLAALLTMLLLLSGSVAVADEMVYINNTFDREEAGALRVEKETRIAMQPQERTIVIELEATACDTETKKDVICIKDDAERVLRLVKFTAGGRISSLNGIIGTYESGVPILVSVLVDLTAKKAVVYLDGKEAGTVSFQNVIFSFDRIASLKFSASKRFPLTIDNVKVYSGSSFLTAEQVNSQRVGAFAADEDISEFEGTTVLFDGSDKVYAWGTKTTTGGAMPYELDGVHYLPLVFVARLTNTTVTTDGTAITLQGTVNGSAEVGGKFVMVGDKKQTLAQPIVRSGDQLYISDADACSLFDLYAVTKQYTTVIGNKSKVDKITGRYDLLETIFRSILFTIPDEDTLLSSLRPSHPRIFATDDTFAKIRSYIADGDERAVRWLENARTIADTGLKRDKVQFTRSDGMRMDESRGIGYTEQMAFLYRVTGEKKYFDKTLSQLKAVCEFPTWNEEGQFLDTANVMQTVAICYDWLYDGLCESDKQLIHAAIREKAFAPAIKQYKSGAFWVKANHNWNAVCNSGVAMLASVVLDEPDMQADALELLGYSFQSIRYMMSSFRPDGAWQEGVGYWYYMTRSLVQYFWSLETAYGTAFGLPDAPGIKETGYFPAYMVGPNGIFNISEGEAYDYVDAPEIAWFANYLQDDGLRSLRYHTMERYGMNGNMIDLLLYTPEKGGADSSLPTDKYYRGLEAVVMQTDWNDPNEVYLGFVGGSNGYNHGHMDVGMFNFDANGVRWAIGLPGDNYNLPGYFAQGEGGQTWTYYRLRAEGHNTLVINPDSWGGQRVSTMVNSPITTFASNSAEGYAIADLTENYNRPSGAKEVDRLLRGVKLDKDNGIITVQDEISLTAQGTVYWFMHTEAEIALSEDGKTAYLTKDGKQCEVALASPSKAKFVVMDAKPLETSPNPEGQADNSIYQKLTVVLPDVKDTTLSVVFYPFDNRAEKNADKITPLEDWSLTKTEQQRSVYQIYADGEELTGFSETVMSVDYIMKRDDTANCIVPKITSPEAVKIIEPEQYPGTVKLLYADGSMRFVNVSDKLVFSTEPVKLPAHAQAVKIQSVAASGFQTGNEPEHIFDGDLETRWSAEGEQSITFDLGDIHRIEYASFAFFKGISRKAMFDIETSPDGVQWVTVYDGASLENTEQLQAVRLLPSNCRYIRYNGHGSSDGKWNSVNEAVFYTGSETGGET